MVILNRVYAVVSLSDTSVNAQCPERNINLPHGEHEQVEKDHESHISHIGIHQHHIIAIMPNTKPTMNRITPHFLPIQSTHENTPNEYKAPAITKTITTIQPHCSMKSLIIITSRFPAPFLRGFGHNWGLIWGLLGLKYRIQPRDMRSWGLYLHD